MVRAIIDIAIDVLAAGLVIVGAFLLTPWLGFVVSGIAVFALNLAIGSGLYEPEEIDET